MICKNCGKDISQDNWVAKIKFSIPSAVWYHEDTKTRYCGVDRFDLWTHAEPVPEGLVRVDLTVEVVTIEI